MLEFAAHESRMRQPVRDSEGKVKGTVREEMRGLARRHPDKVEPDPEVGALSYVWDWFDDLILGRRYTVNGPEPFTYLDIDAWARRMNESPEPYEVRALLLVDAIYRNPPDEEVQ